VHQPHLIFLDEPTAALDPRARREIREMVRTLAIVTFRWDPDASPVRRDWLSRSQEVRTGLRARI
jgi:ABC-type uncharacterized transport system YnjBCD ATPase subunit